MRRVVSGGGARHHFVVVVVVISTTLPAGDDDGWRSGRSKRLTLIHGVSETNMFKFNLLKCYSVSRLVDQ